jgi:hypothetical protein
LASIGINDDRQICCLCPRHCLERSLQTDLRREHMSCRWPSATTDALKVTAWNAWDICNLILESNFTTNWRVGLALFGIVQCFGTVGTNLFANSIPFGCDWAGVFPKWINIIRGQVICMLFSWAVCPWAILTSGARVSLLISQAFNVLTTAVYHFPRFIHCLYGLFHGDITW